MKGLLIYIPEELHKKFKIYCIRHNTTHKDAIIEFIKGLPENEQN